MASCTIRRQSRRQRRAQQPCRNLSTKLIALCLIFLPCRTSASTSSTSTSSLSSSTSGYVLGGFMVCETCFSPTYHRAGSATVKSSAGISGGAIAGIVVGVVGGIGLIVLAVFLWRRHRDGHGGQFDPPEPYNAVTQSEPFLGKSVTHMGTVSGIPAVSYQSTPYNPGEYRSVEASISYPN